MLLPGPNLHCVGALALGEFRNIFLPNIREDQKKVLTFECGALRTVQYGKSSLIISLLHYIHKKVR